MGEEACYVDRDNSRLTLGLGSEEEELHMPGGSIFLLGKILT
jgi:hypothetical protein